MVATRLAGGHWGTRGCLSIGRGDVLVEMELRLEGRKVRLVELTRTPGEDTWAFGQQDLRMGWLLASIIII